MKEMKIWVIAFKDGEDINYWRIEILDKNGDFEGYGKVKTFDNKAECEKWILDYTDSRAFDFYATEITEQKLNDYENKMD
jgi:hypothetical protein